MLELLAVVLAAGGLAAAQDMSAIVTDDSDNGLLAYTTITTACLPAVDPNNEPIFSIQTDTNIESCTYVVNADNTQQVRITCILGCGCHSFMKEPCQSIHSLVHVIRPNN